MSSTSQLSFERKLLFIFIGIASSLFLVIAGGEIVMRINNVPIGPPYNGKEKDKILGWKTKPYYRYYTKEFSDNKNGKYEVNLNFTKHGFRLWNEKAHDSTQGNVFVVGDSYVESIEVSDDKTFYSVFKDSCPVKVSAYGTAGYGFTQEYLIMNQFIDSLNPKWIVLLTCSNDYVDNYWKMEEKSWYTAGQTRPYLNLQSKIEYHFPRPWYERAKDYSLFLDFIFRRIRQGLINAEIILPDGVPDHAIERQDKNYDDFEMTCILSENVLKKMKLLAESHQAKLLVYILGDLNNTINKMDAIVAACKLNNIAIITGAEELTLIHEKKGETIHSFDNYHFNNNGQKILGQVLIDYFRKNELADKP